MSKKLKRHPGYLALHPNEREALLDLLDAERYGVLSGEQFKTLGAFKERVREYKEPELTNRQKNNAKARKETAKREQELQTRAAYLQKHRAWNWVWPDERNRFYTNAPPVRGPLCSYSGPSKSIIAGRERRKRRNHNYKAVVL